MCSQKTVTHARLLVLEFSKIVSSYMKNMFMSGMRLFKILPSRLKAFIVTNAIATVLIASYLPLIWLPTIVCICLCIYGHPVSDVCVETSSTSKSISFRETILTFSLTLTSVLSAIILALSKGASMNWTLFSFIDVGDVCILSNTLSTFFIGQKIKDVLVS